MIKRVFRTKEDFLYVFAFFVIIILLFLFYSNNINLKVAWGGFGPPDYVSQKIHPENYQKNFSGANLANLYDSSLVMKTFYYAKKIFNIEPEEFVYPYMFGQILLLVIAIALLSYSIFKNKHFAFISTCVILMSNLAGLNLSRFLSNGISQSLEYPLYYGYAYGFSFLAFHFFIKNKLFLSFMFLALSLCAHLTIGIFASVFIGIYFLVNFKNIFSKKMILPCLIYFIIVIPWLLNIIFSSLLNTEKLPDADWIKATKMFGFHWYPIIMNTFTTRAHKEFIPIFISIFLFFISLKYVDLHSEEIKKIIYGVIGCILLTIIGIFFVEVLEVPFFIKLSLQRSTTFISFSGVLFYIYYLYKNIEQQKTIPIIISILAVTFLIYSIPGISILCLLVLIFFDIKENKFGPLSINDKNRKYFLSSYYSISIFLIIINFLNLTKLYAIKRIWAPLQYLNPVNGFDFLLKGGALKVSHLVFIKFLIILSIFILFYKILKIKINSDLYKKIIIITQICFFIFSIFYLKNRIYGNYKLKKIAEAYLNVQLWARDNTSKNSLFMQNPIHSYAWRDFSQRSSFGSFRDWGYTCIVFRQDKNIFEEGKRRMKEFGVDFDSITIEEIEGYHFFPYETKFRKKIHDNFVSMSVKRRYELCKKYGITHVVIQKRKFSDKNISKLKQSFELVYENNEYDLFKVNDLKYLEYLNKNKKI